MPKVSEINSFLGKILDGEELLSIERKEKKKLLMLFPTSLENLRGFILDQSHWSQSCMKLLQYDFNKICQEL